MEDFIKYSTDAICLVNSEDLEKGEIVFVNRSFTRLFQLDHHVFLYEKFSSLFKCESSTGRNKENMCYISKAEIIKETIMDVITFRNSGITYSLIKMRALDYRLMSKNIVYKELIDTKSQEYGNSPGYLVGIELYCTDTNDNYASTFSNKMVLLLEEELKARLMTGTVYEENEFIMLFTTEELRTIVPLVDEFIQQVEAGETLYEFGYKYKLRIGVSDQSNVWEDLLSSMSHTLNGFLEGQFNHCIYYNKYIDMNITGLLQEDIEHGLLNDEFVLYCQPIINIKEKCMSGIEILIRWNHPAYGILYPIDFLLKAEHSNQIVQMDIWVIEKSLQLIKQYKSELANMKVHVNLSPKSLEGDQLIPIIDKYKDEEVLKNLIIEINEESDTVIITDTFVKLQSYGILFAIDDFGRGFSSFERMGQVGVKVVKIDRSFIKNIVSNHDDIIILESVIKMCNNLNMLIVAEGIETIEQLNCLYNFDCTSIQGYYFCKPVDFEEFIVDKDNINEKIMLLLDCYG